MWQAQCRSRLVGLVARVGLVGLVLATSAALAAAADLPLAVTLGTATPGGGFPVYGDAVLKTVAQTDPQLKIEARNTRGSLENIPLLEQGKLDFGLVQGEAAYEAWNGIGRPPAQLAIVAAMYSTPGMFIVRADSPASSIADLRGKRVAFGARSSGLVLLARYVLDGIGMDMERDFQAIFLDRAGDGPDMLAKGQVDALWGAGSSWPGFVTVMGAPGGGRFIVPDVGERERILARHTFLKTLTLPAGSFKGEDQPLVSVGSWSFIMARPDRNEEAAYRLARALHRGQASIAGILPQARETTAANTLRAAPRPGLLHPGTARFLAEAGIRP
ncbi:MAG: transporter, phosphonate, periplasmic substrate-binding protein [Paucimonas sp.]|nr:transporter, phosphonate, periplasmic substrate-binding protein [Paucimonas sp.]